MSGEVLTPLVDFLCLDVHPLHLLLRKKNFEACKVAVEELGATVNHSHPQHHFPLWHAFKFKVADVALAFFRHGDLDIVSTKYYDVPTIFEATRRGWNDVVAEILQKTDEMPETVDCEYFHPNSGISLLSMAIIKQLEPPVIGKIINRLKTREVINRGSPNSGTTALLTAVMMGDCQSADLLCKNGADANLADAKGIAYEQGLWFAFSSPQD